MIELLFHVPLYSYRVENWEEKKKNFISKIDQNDNFVYYELNEFKTDRHTAKNNYITDFETIFYDELTEFLRDANLKYLRIKDIWTLKYTKIHENHCPHNHSSTGYTGLLYLEYDSLVHEPTKFIGPWNDPITDRTMISSISNPTPGVIYIWPSFILHYVEYMKTDKLRMVTSWDMEVG